MNGNCEKGCAEVVRQTQVNVQQAIMDDATSQLLAQIRVMETRLTRVLCEKVPTTSDERKEPVNRPDLVALATETRDYSERVQVANRSIESMLDRLEL
jgi:hypothetical protein